MTELCLWLLSTTRTGFNKCAPTLVFLNLNLLSQFYPLGHPPSLMFSHRSNSRSLPGAEKKSFIARLRPLFGRSKQITPDTPRSAYVIVQQPDRVSSSSAFHQFIPSLPSSPQFPLVDPQPRSWERNYAVVPIRECSTPGVPMNVASEFPPTSIVVQRSVYSTPNMGSPSTFLPPSPSSGFVGSPAEGAGHPPVSLGPPGLPPVAARPQTGSRQSTSHYVMSSRGHPANSSSTRLSRPSRLSQQVPPFGLQTIPPVLSTVEPSSYLAVQESSWHHNTTRSVNYEAVSGGQDEQYKPSWQGPPKRKLKPPSAEYLATPLSDNPLGLIGMTPVYVYV